MEQYIPKSALVAEIERRISQLESKYKELANLEIWITAKEIEHKINGLKEALSIINALEVKGVDLEKEIDQWQGCEAFPEGVGITPLPKAMKIVERTAKHFFELGMQVSNKAHKEEKI